MSNTWSCFGIFAFLWSWSALAHESKPCFDLTTKNTTLLHEAPKEFSPEKNITDKGRNTSEVDWATVNGTVNQSISDIYTRLLDPKTVRSGDNVKVIPKEEENKNYLKLIEQSITLKPVFFLTLTWKEHWAYALKDGTAEAPKSIVISYEKFEGTSHISRFCGNILLQSLAPKKTGVFIYQEMKAERRNAQNVLDDIAGTLRTLQK